MWYILNFIIGAIFGSFLNVIIYRGVEGLSIKNPPRSFCPNCKTRLKWYDNIPILSFLILKGKCRYCGTKISPRYLFIELILSFGFLIHYIVFAFPIALILDSLLFVTLAVIFIDLKIMMIPDFAWIVVGLAGFLDVFLNGDFLFRILAFSIVLLVLLILKFLYRDSLGSGDIFLMTAFSFLLSLPLAFYMMIISSVLGILFAIVKRSKIIPFGPFISLSGYILYILNVLYFLK
ncbi:MAG: prepilin peptidase [Thermosipho sp. (in: Bacteria)]|nr:prepilin peptidase [Thermosipho sp. (in: thermotogales)]